MTVVVDDHVLLELLVDSLSSTTIKHLSGHEVFTTGSWYYRLGRAVTSGSGEGSLSQRATELDDARRSRLTDSLLDLPEEIGLLGFRTVVPTMLTLRLRRALNLLTAEAIAVAVIVGAEIITKTRSDLLESAARDLALRCTVVA